MLEACAFSSESPKSELEVNFQSPVFKNPVSSWNLGVISAHGVGCTGSEGLRL